MTARRPARIEAHPVEIGDRWLTLLVDWHGQPIALLSPEALGSVLDDNGGAGADDLIDYCGADLLAIHFSRGWPAEKIAAMLVWVERWRKERVRPDSHGGRWNVLRGECERCDRQAVASSPGGDRCEQEECWPCDACGGAGSWERKELDEDYTREAGTCRECRGMGTREAQMAEGHTHEYRRERVRL